MFPAPALLILLVLASPLFLIFDGTLIHGVIAAVAAGLGAIVGLRIRSGEAEFLSSLIRPLALVAAVPFLVILIQLMPLASLGLANSIWQSAGAALSRPVLGSVTVDPGATLICMARYLSLAGLSFVASAVAIDRRRAKWVLFALVTAAALTTLMVLTAEFGVGATLNIHDRALSVSAATGTAVLGIILAVAGALQALEYADTPSPDRDSPVMFLPVFVLCLVALATCLFAVVKYAASGVYFALAFGVVTFVAAIITRRFELDIWGYSAAAATIAVIAVAAVALRSDGVRDLTFAFADSPQSPSIILARRILAETSWLGTGAGTYAAILPIYRDINELGIGDAAPTAAAAIAIEMGRPFLWAAMIGAIALVVVLLRGAARRRRDSLYPIAGASCVVAMIVLAFNNHGVFNTAVLVIAVTTVGLGIAQSKSRSN
jgi:hypothetical protein